MDTACVYPLTDSERNQLSAALGKINYDPQGGQNYITDLRIMADSNLPRRVIDVLANQRASLRPKPYLVFENLPTDEAVFTTPDPEVFTPAAKSGTLSENLIMAFASMIGEPYSIQFEGADIVNNLIPSPSAKREYTGLGSQVELSFHVENAALKYMENAGFSPLGLLLTGVRHDPQGPMTRLADARAALLLLEASDVVCLRQPLYRIKVPHRWRNQGTFATEPVAMLSGDLDFPEVSAVFYPDMVEALSTPAANAMTRFHDAIRQVSVAVDIKPGQLLYIDNRFTLHARDSFEPSLDKLSKPLRWVQRVFVSKSLWSHRQLERVQSRIFLPRDQTP